MFDSLKIHIGGNAKQFKMMLPMKMKKLFTILLWYCRKRTKRCGTRSFCRTFRKTHRFLKKSIKTCHNNQQIKIKSVKANLQIREFRGKNEDEMKKFGKINLVFEFSISKLGYMAIFMKICVKKIDPFCRTFLTNQGKIF